jgi:hypothetical protein
MKSLAQVLAQTFQCIPIYPGVLWGTEELYMYMNGWNQRGGNAERAKNIISTEDSPKICAS